MTTGIGEFVSFVPARAKKMEKKDNEESPENDNGGHPTQSKVPLVIVENFSSSSVNSSSAAESPREYFSFDLHE